MLGRPHGHRAIHSERKRHTHTVSLQPLYNSLPCLSSSMGCTKSKQCTPALCRSRLGAFSVSGDSTQLGKDIDAMDAGCAVASPSSTRPLSSRSCWHESQSMSGDALPSCVPAGSGVCRHSSATVEAEAPLPPTFVPGTLSAQQLASPSRQPRGAATRSRGVRRADAPPPPGTSRATTASCAGANRHSDAPATPAPMRVRTEFAAASAQESSAGEQVSASKRRWISATLWRTESNAQREASLWMNGGGLMSPAVAKFNAQRALDLGTRFHSPGKV